MLNIARKIGSIRAIRYIAYVILAILFAILYIHALTRFDMLPGIDGPYYAVQVMSIAKTGHLKYPDPPLIFYAMYLLYRVTRDVFLGVAIGVTLFIVSASIAIAYLVERITGSFIAGATSMVVFLLAPFELKLAGDFMKNAAGLLWIALLLLYIYIAMHRRRELKQRLYNAVTAFVILTLCGLTHVLDYGFALSLAIAIPLIQFIASRGRARDTNYEFAIAALATLALFYVAPWLQGGDLYKAFSIVESFGHSSPTPRGIAKIPRPRLGPPTPISIPTICSILNWLTITLLLLLGIRSKDRRCRAILVSLAICLIPLALPLWPIQVSVRLQLMGGVPLSIALGTLVGSARHAIDRVLLMIAFTGLIATLGIIALNAIAPSIPPLEYQELKNIVEEINEIYNGNACFVVRDTRLRYWVETIADNVYKSPAYCSTNPVFIDEKFRAPSKLSSIRIVFRGRYVIAWTWTAPGSSRS